MLSCVRWLLAFEEDSRIESKSARWEIQMFLRRLKLVAKYRREFAGVIVRRVLKAQDTLDCLLGARYLILISNFEPHTYSWRTQLSLTNIL